jgi:hypothetical protein
MQMPVWATFPAAVLVIVKVSVEVAPLTIGIR